MPWALQKRFPCFYRFTLNRRRKVDPEVNIPEAFAGKGQFIPICPPEVHEKYAAIWKEVTE